jgi:hypothetical protein
VPNPGSTLPDLRPDLSELRAVGSDRQIAEHVQHVTAADRVAVDRGDHRLRDVADHAVQVLDFEPEV